MTRDELIEWCRTRGTCGEARRWLGSLHASASLADAWASCERGDWMLWLAATAGVDRLFLVEAACDCADKALAHAPTDDERPARAIAVARAWVRGEATADEARAAADDACHAAEAAADRVADRSAAYAAACAARTVVDASAAARAAAYAADAAVYGTRDATARAAAYAQHAALVRSRISVADVEAAMLAA